MSNTGPLGGEGISFLRFVLVPWLRKTSRSGLFEIITKEEEDSIVLIHATLLKGNSIVSTQSFVCAF